MHPIIQVRVRWGTSISTIYINQHLILSTSWLLKMQIYMLPFGHYVQDVLLTRVEYASGGFHYLLDSFGVDIHGTLIPCHQRYSQDGA
jgi:hypothetical protein